MILHRQDVDMTSSRLRARLPGASSSTSVDLEHPMLYTLIRDRPSATNSSRSYLGCLSSNIPSPQLTRKKRTVSSSVLIKKSCAIFAPCFLTYACTTFKRTATYGTTYHENCREDIRRSHSCQTHPQQLDTLWPKPPTEMSEVRLSY
jgi:hypothetical protein